ncbi:eCIS core domain-containing protein [Micromonospora okii]|uniref:eCIS core domain-containing protein n=1 Tax=Micromonospora okii TaxID=1182970 RepID=UPI001E2ABC43|nr:DUF4157 domain-containing protein [Micromonospora okii]
MRARQDPERQRLTGSPHRTTPVQDAALAPARPTHADLGPEALTPAALAALQRAIGNSEVNRLLAGESPVQRSTVPEVLRSPGAPLDEVTRVDMEARLGADFSDVRLHTGTAAEQSASEIGARAYTSGNHVVIGRGGGDPHTLAHELTHVVQQRLGAVDGTDRGDGLRVSDPSDRFEREAEENATRALSAAPASLAAPPEHHAAHPGHDAGSPAVQRMIAVMDQQTGEGSLIEANDVPNHPAFAGLGLPPAMIADLQALAADDEIYEVEEALAVVRHTVTGGVNVVSKEEASFLGGLAKRRGQVSSYDPDMTSTAQFALASVGVPAGAVVLHRDSITAFGNHVPHTDIFVPHPGPWTKLPPPNDLASCLDVVMGPASHAYVLTDNEPAQGFAESLLAGINRVNSANAGAAGHSPLTVTVRELNVQEGSEVELGNAEYERTSVPLKTQHQPSYRLVRVSRA